jgi:hypothetical protein
MPRIALRVRSVRCHPERQPGKGVRHLVSPRDVSWTDKHPVQIDVYRRGYTDDQELCDA